MKRLILLLALVFVCLFAVPSEESDAVPSGEVHDLHGNIIFTDDVTYAPGDIVYIADNTTIDMFTFDWNIGEGSTIVIQGKLTLMTYSGTINIGKDTSLLMHGTVLLGFGVDVSYSFLGLIEFSGDFSAEDPAIKFRPITDDHCIYISWEGQTLSVGDLLMYQTGTDRKYERVFGFSSFSLDITYYDDDGGIVSERSAEMDIKDPSKVITVGIDLDEQTTYVTVMPLNGIVATDYYPASETVSTFAVKDMEEITIAVGADGFGHVIAGAGEVLSVKTVGGAAASSLLLSDVDFTADMDIQKTIELIIGGITGDTPDIIRNLLLTQSEAGITDATYKTQKTLTDVVGKVDPSADPDRYFSLSAADGDLAILMAYAKPVVESYTLSWDFVLDIDCTVPTITLILSSGGETAVTTIQDTGLVIERLDLKSLYLLYSRTGTLALQHLLDNSGSFNFDAERLTVDDDGDGTPEVSAEELSAVMMKDARNIYTLTVSLDSLFADFEVGDRPMLVDLKRTDIYMESSGHLSECLDALLNSSHFTADAHAEIQISNSGFEVNYQIPGGGITFKGGKTSEVSPTSASVIISMDHKMINDQTVISGRFSSAGYSVSAILHKTYTDPEGMLDVTAEQQDANMSFDVTFGNGITYSQSMTMPFDFSFGYYGIDLSGTFKATSLGITRGSLSVDDFDVSERSILSLPIAMLTNDFRTEFRLSSDLTDVRLYNQGDDFLSYDDITFDSRRVVVDVDWSDKAAVDLYEIRLHMCHTDGSELKKELDHLTLDLDIVKEPQEKPLIDTVLEIALIPCIVLITAMVLYLLRLKRIDPELFTFNEFEQHELAHLLPEPEDEDDADDGIIDDAGEE